MHDATEDELISDGQLVARLLKREGAAMGELYDRYGNIAHSVIIRIVGDHQISEDLVQETFLRIWSCMHLYEPARGALRPWILVIARNQAIDYLRSAAGRSWTARVGVDRLEQLPAPASKDEDSVATVEAALHRLTENQKNVLHLAYFQGMSQAEIAKNLKQPLGTVKSWVRTALHVLRGEVAAKTP